MLNILFAPPSIDLCSELLSRVDPKKRFLLIVPRHYSHECERKLGSVLGDAASSYCEVLSVDRLYTRVATERGGTAEHFLDHAGKLLVAYSAAQRVSSEMRTFGGELRDPQFLSDVLQLIDELHGCHVAPDKLGSAAEQIEGELGHRLHDLALITESYYAELAQKNTLCDRTDALISLLENGWADDKAFAFFGYTEFTEQELELLRRLLHSQSVTVALRCDRSLINPALGDEDPLYTYARTLGSLRRLAESEGVPVKIEDIPDSGLRPAPLRFIAREFSCGEAEQFDGDASTAVTLCEELSVWKECERAAAYILENVHKNGMRFEDFAVALPKGDNDYSGALEAVFGSWGIPTFMDSTTPALEAPILSALSSAMDILRGGWASDDVIRYLKSGLSPLSFKECCELENYAYTWQINGHKWLQDFQGSPKGFTTESEDQDAHLSHLNELRRTLVLPFENFLEKIRLSGIYSANELLRAYYELLEELELDKRIIYAANSYADAGDLKVASEYSQLWGKVCDLIDEFSELAGSEPMKFDEFAQLFELLLGGIHVGVIPPALDGVPVGEVGRIRHRSPKALLLLGARAGVFPPVPTSNGLLDDSDREVLSLLELGLEPSSRRLAWRGIDTAFSALTLPSEQLYISWSPSAEGGTTSPGILIQQLAQALNIPIQPPSDYHRLLHAPTPALELALRAAVGMTDGAQLAALKYFSERPEYNDVIDRARNVAENRRGPLSSVSATALYGEHIKLNASRNDLYMRCPFSYFCRYGLRAKPRKLAELDSLESGTLIHNVLEQTIRKVSEQGLLHEEITYQDRFAAFTIAHDELAHYIETQLGKAVTEDARTNQLFTRLEHGLMQVVSSILDEFAASSFRPKGFEVRFGTDEDTLGKLYIGDKGYMDGSIDRVDTWTDPSGHEYFRVIDYKSGNKHFDFTDIFHGSSLQLPIYLHALRNYADTNDIAVDTAGAFYSPASEAVYVGKRNEDHKVIGELDKLQRRSGVYLMDPNVSDAMEHGGANRFLPSVSRYKLTKEQFDQLDRHTTRRIEDVISRISAGEIDASPSARSQYSACDNCDFAAVCKFDPSNGKDTDRYRNTIKPDDFWNHLSEEDDANA